MSQILKQQTSSKSRRTMTSRYAGELSWRISRIPCERKERGDGGKDEDGPYLRPKRRTPLRFDQIQEGPQDPFCADAPSNVEENHGTTERRGEYRRWTERGRIPRLTIGMFSGSPIQRRRRKKREAPRIYRVTLGLFQYRPNWYCRHLSCRCPFITKAAYATAALIFSFTSTRDFFQASSRYSGKYDDV